MKYGLIGEHLVHSFSREIHSKIAPYSYELLELGHDEVAPFLEKREFNAINVTIPYKEAVMPHLDEIDDAARKIGAVNTIVNKNGRLFGYNTDFYGMCELVKKNGVSLMGKKVLILGTGGTSQTAQAVSSHLGAGEIVVVSRSERDGYISYEKAKSLHSDAQIIINTTPCGMYPYADGAEEMSARAIDISDFKSLEAYFDAIYNPLRTNSILDARERGIVADGGLYMLVAQATAAYELFMDKRLKEEKNIQIYNEIVCEKENIVLVGMPGSGKSTVARALAKDLGRCAYDTDRLIVERAGMPVSEIFEKYGEAHFRDLESEVIAELSSERGVIISTGGGAVLRKENVHRLRRNGRIYFLDRPLDEIRPSFDRPLSQDREALEKIYNERYGAYHSSSDCVIIDFDSIEKTAKAVIGDFFR